MIMIRDTRSQSQALDPPLIMIMTLIDWPKWITQLMFAICKFLDRDISIHPISRIGLHNPDKGVLIRMCCVDSGYHAVVSHVKMNHDTFATDNQRVKLSIRSAQKTWSVFA